MSKFSYHINFKNIKANIDDVIINKQESGNINSVILKYKTFNIRIKAIGDCCSYSYITDFDFTQLKNKTINSIERIHTLLV